MATDSTTGGSLSQWYQNRIGQPATGDEIRGYWIFVLGVLLDIVGILLFLPSTSASALRQWAIVFAAAGLVFVFAGPMVRLPLQGRTTLLVYLGIVVSGLTIVWFIFAFPRSWSPQTGQPTIIALYSLGLFLIGAGGVFVPLLTSGAEAEAEREALREEVDELREELLDTEADENDLSRLVTDLRRALRDTEANEADLRAMVDQLQKDVADTEADEEDLAAQLRAVRTSQTRFELYEDNAGEFRWRLRHRNGNLIANSGEGYTRRHNVQKGMQSVRRNALGATVLHIDDEADLPAADEEFEPVEELASQAMFELYEDNAGEYRFRLRHENGNILADSSEGYASRGGARTAIDRIRDYVGPADYLWFETIGFEIYRDNAGKWHWRLVHRNRNILADSGEGYSRRRNARRAINRIRERIDNMEFELYEDDAGEYRWRLRSSNDQIMADSGEGYADRSGTEEAIDRVRDYIPEADVLDIGQAAFEIYEDSTGEYRWRLRHRNGNILADSGEGYSDRSGARDGLESVKQNAPNAATQE